MSPRPFDLVLFDLDGTLVDTAPEITDAVNAWLAELGRPRVTLETVSGAIGHGVRRLLERVADEDVTPAQLRRFAHRYRARCVFSRPYPGAVDIVRALQEDGIRTALVTNKEQRFVRPILESGGLAAYFAVTVCGDTLRARKPDPLPIQHCLDYLGVAPGRALLVGDSAIDVAAARNAGVAVWIVSGGYGDAAEIAASQPDRIVPGLDALEELLGPAGGGPPPPSPRSRESGRSEPSLPPG